MTRRSTVVWIASAVIVCGVGIGVAAHAAANPAVGAPEASGSASPTPPAGSASAPATTAPAASPSASSGPAAPNPEPPYTFTPAPTPSSSASASAAPSASSSAGSVQTVTPTLGYYAYKGGTLSLGGGVSGLVDSGGTCTVTLRKGTVSVSRDFRAEPGPSSTDCGEMEIASPDFSTGTWSLTIRYSSPRAAGISTATEVPL